MIAAHCIFCRRALSEPEANRIGCAACDWSDSAQPDPVRWRCIYCGEWSLQHPQDQRAPSDYCHESDHQ